MKQKAIIDTTNFRDDYYIYPFLFLFMVMWKLDKDYGIKKVPVKKVWTYVFTCKSMDDLNDCVSWLFDPTAKISPFVDGTNGYKGNSRMMKLILENTMMFSQENDHGQELTPEELLSSLNKTAAQIDKERKQLSDISRLRDELKSSEALIKKEC